MLKNISLTFLLLLLVSPGFAEETDLQAVLAELQQAAAETHSLSSNFEQEKHLTIFAETLFSQGRFVYQKPDRLRWELLTPVASGFVLQGKQGERWNALSREQRSFSVKNDSIMGMIAQQLLAWARVDLDWLQNRYRIELQSSEPISLRLYPINADEAGLISYLQVLFSADHRHVAEVLMVDQEGDSTLLRFSDVQINTKLPTDAFAVPEF